MGTHALNKLLGSGAESSQCMWCCLFDMAHNYDMKVSVLALCDIHTGYVISKTLQFQPLQDPSDADVCRSYFCCSNYLHDTTN